VEGNELTKLKKPTKQKQKLTYQRKRKEKIERKKHIIQSTEP